MAKIKDESIFQGIIEFDGPNTGTRFRFERQGCGIYHRYARPAGRSSFAFDGQVRLSGGRKATPEMLLSASELEL